MPGLVGALGLWSAGLVFAGWRILGRRGLRISAIHLPITAGAIIWTSTAPIDPFDRRLLGFVICVVDATVHAIRLQRCGKRMGITPNTQSTLNLLLGFTVAGAIPSLAAAALLNYAF